MCKARKGLAGGAALVEEKNLVPPQGFASRVARGMGGPRLWGRPRAAGWEEIHPVFLVLEEMAFSFE